MVIAFIPARGGSKSIPLKNIRNFCGQPLIYWNLKALSLVEEVDVVYVSTDSPEIEEVIEGFNFDKVKIFRRGADSASDTASTESAVLEFLESKVFPEDAIFMLTQATSPLTSRGDFSRAIGQFKKGNYDSLLSCVRTKRFFWSESGESINYDYKKRPRRQDFAGTLMENGAIYISKVGDIVSSQNRLSGNVGVYEMPEYTAVEIDEPDDWSIAEGLMVKHGLRDDLKEGEIKLFLTDVDGTMTDSGMYYSSRGDEFKKFNTRDGMAFELLRDQGIKTGIITTEDTKIVADRASKVKADYLVQGVSGGGKLEAAQDICKKEGIHLGQVAYIGDDVNCRDLLKSVGYAACPADAASGVKSLDGIRVMSSAGGHGAVREFAEYIIERSS